MTQKGHLQYLIRASRDGWKLSAAGQDLGAFARRGDALRAAIADCEYLCRLGHDVDIHLLAPGGERRTLWSHQSARAATG